MITPLTNVTFSAKLKDGKQVKLRFATEKGKVFAAMYFVQIDLAEILLDIRRCVENKQHLEDELKQHKDKAFRAPIVKRVLAEVTTDFILKNKYKDQ